MSEQLPATPFPDEEPPELAERLERARALCAGRGLRLTAMREQVLRLILAARRPVKAYELLERLRGEHGKVAPPTVYRALAFLEEAGLVHRLESRSAFTGCTEPGHGHTPQFLLCRRCDTAAELAVPGLVGEIGRESEAHGFLVEDLVLEVRGLCPACRSAAPDRA
ncbi:Fur family transcriptional regulator [Thiohalorhabdus sp. Cl-TMA]|uniref:Ferric uptake regulation protein n=1 Tax=Thiohalorhabdus methylotrophus TaxID=3242694 RepID=A0ABV4TVP8_9GAMM